MIVERTGLITGCKTIQWYQHILHQLFNMCENSMLEVLNFTSD